MRRRDVSNSSIYVRNDILTDHGDFYTLSDGLNFWLYSARAEDFGHFIGVYSSLGQARSVATEQD